MMEGIPDAVLLTKTWTTSSARCQTTLQERKKHGGRQWLPSRDHIHVHLLFKLALDRGISQWLLGRILKWEDSIPQQHHDAIDIATLEGFLSSNQQDIGWNQVIRGLISKQWAIAHSLYCRKWCIDYIPTGQSPYNGVQMWLWNCGTTVWSVGKREIGSYTETQVWNHRQPFYTWTWMGWYNICILWRRWLTQETPYPDTEIALDPLKRIISLFRHGIMREVLLWETELDCTSHNK